MAIVDCYRLSSTMIVWDGKGYKPIYPPKRK